MSDAIVQLLDTLGKLIPVKFTAKFNFIFQLSAVILQIANISLPYIPDKYKPYITTAIAVLQVVAGFKAHMVNPDGTTAALPWVKKSD